MLAAAEAGDIEAGLPAAGGLDAGELDEVDEAGEVDEADEGVAAR